jgi:hypothetical protein
MANKYAIMILFRGDKMIIEMRILKLKVNPDS